jgi:hypothetical protein
VHNPHHRGRDDLEGCSLSPKGPGLEASGRDVCDAHFPKSFLALGNVIKYDDKTNSSVWLEEYRLTCREGGMNEDLFIIQFIPMYLVDCARAWLNHLPRNIIASWEDL